MNTRAIDFVTEDFYESLSFQDGELPDFETFRDLFYGEGLLINNSYGQPLLFNSTSYSQQLETQIAEEKVTQFMQRELYSKTEIFGKVAQRLSVYEYSFADYQVKDIPKGINYIQFILTEDTWKITSVAWCDENENYQIPEEYLS